MKFFLIFFANYYTEEYAMIKFNKRSLLNYLENQIFFDPSPHYKDGRIVSGSADKTLSVWGYVDSETGDAS